MKPHSATSVVYDRHGNAIAVDKEQFAEAVDAARPGTTVQSGAAEPAHQVVYMSRPHDPVKPVISDEIKQKHEQSARRYQGLNLSEGEYVISAIRRHPIGLIQIWGVVVIAILLLAMGIVMTMNGASTETLGVPSYNVSWLAMILLGLMVLVFFGGVIATVVYDGNRFFLTNESVTQHIQMSLFSKKEQTISLINIEDASFRQIGVVQTLLNYGTLRLSTQGDETTYRFSYVSDPANQVALLNDAVEAFKNGRPVEDND